MFYKCANCTVRVLRAIIFGLFRQHTLLLKGSTHMSKSLVWVQGQMQGCTHLYWVVGTPPIPSPLLAVAIVIVKPSSLRLIFKYKILSVEVK